MAHEQRRQQYEVVDLFHSTIGISKCTSNVNESSIAVITLRDSCNDTCPLKQSVMVELQSARFGHTITADIVIHSSSSYEARYTPMLRTRGHCELLVMVDGRKIGREPVKVFVKCPPHLLGEPVHILQNGIKKPCYLGIVGDRVFCMLSQAICTIDLQKRDACPSHFLAIPNTIKIWSPEEMTIAEHSDSVFVSDSYNNKIHKFKSTDGEYTTSTGGKGSRPGKLNRPNGLCVARTGSHLYICDSDNHRIQVFDLDLKFVRCFGSQGSKPGQFMWPDNVAVGLNGVVYVTDLENHRIRHHTGFIFKIAFFVKMLRSKVMA